MSDLPGAVYLDANTILHYLTETPGKHEPLAQLFADPDGPTFWTSTLSVAEVAYFTEFAGMPNIDAGLSAIEEFWAERHVRLFEPTQRAMELARDFIRACVNAEKNRADTENKIRKRSVDAVHLGCAIWVNAQELWTYDGKFIELAPQSKKVRIREPWVSKLPLFDASIYQSD